MTDGKLIPFKRPSSDHLEKMAQVHDEYADRLKRVKEAIERINKLMAEVRDYTKEKGH